MIANPALAVILGYLLGSIPTAYIVTRLAKGKDIQQMGSGNVGGLNTFREVGILSAAVVAIVDMGKGTAAIAIAYWLLDVPTLFVMLVGFAAAIGHMWMPFLKFKGGQGIGTTFGALAIALPLYGYWHSFVFYLCAIAVPIFITRNVALSMGVGLGFLPIIIWLTTHSHIATILTTAIAVIITIKFFPTARAAWSKRKSLKGFVFDKVGND